MRFVIPAIWKLHLSHTNRSIPNLSLELFGIQRSIDALAVLVEHTVRAHLLGRPWLSSGIEVNAKDAGQQQIDQTELELDGNRPACRPEQEVDQVHEVGEGTAGFGRDFRGWCLYCGCVIIGIGEWYGGYLVIGRVCRWWWGNGFPGILRFFGNLWSVILNLSNCT